jgi:hypothetical protein
MQGACQSGQVKGGEPDVGTDAQGQRAGGQHVQPALAEEDRQEQAARLDRDNPQWLVVWGIFSHEFVAFPLFRVPQGTILCARSGLELSGRMRQAEKIYGGSRDV